MWSLCLQVPICGTVWRSRWRLPSTPLPWAWKWSIRWENWWIEWTEDRELVLPNFLNCRAIDTWIRIRSPNTDLYIAIKRVGSLRIQIRSPPKGFQVYPNLEWVNFIFILTKCACMELSAVIWIRDKFMKNGRKKVFLKFLLDNRRIRIRTSEQCCGSMTFWRGSGSGSADPLTSGSGFGSGCGSRSIPLTIGSGSRKPENMWIRWIRIRNTASD